MSPLRVDISISHGRNLFESRYRVIKIPSVTPGNLLRTVWLTSVRWLERWQAAYYYQVSVSPRPLEKSRKEQRHVGPRVLGENDWEFG